MRIPCPAQLWPALPSAGLPGLLLSLLAGWGTESACGGVLLPSQVWQGSPGGAFFARIAVHLAVLLGKRKLACSPPD